MCFRMCGMALYKSDLFDAGRIQEQFLPKEPSVLCAIPAAVIIAVSAFFVLAALVRLAWFNITVEERRVKDWEIRNIIMVCRSHPRR